MSVIRAFRAVRPTPEYAAAVAELPYDVMNSDEARAEVAGQPWNFLHVDKAEVDLPPEVDLYDDRVYAKARENLDRLVSAGVCVEDDKPCLYLYRQIMGDRTQTGIVGCAAVDDYLNNVIKKHELTRADKERDRIRHVDACDANTGPIFLTYRGTDAIRAITAKYLAKTPACDFVKHDVRNTVWVIDDDADIAALVAAFEAVPSLYIADGHHRAASAAHVGQMRRQQFPDAPADAPFNYFLAVYFDAAELSIMDYNRVIRDLNGHTPDALLNALGAVMDVTAVGAEAYRPTEKHTFGMLLDGVWYALRAKPGTFDEADPVAGLDVSILQKNVIGPIFGIDDPRTDKRIDFVGGIRGLGELERRCGADMRVAFSMYPTTLDDLMSIADAGKIMPPKSTWFEPKLLSGLFIHKLS